MHLMLSWLVLTFAFLIAARLISGVKIDRFRDAAVVAACFGVLNFFLGWLLFVVIGLATFGLGFFLAFLTHWIVDALLLKLTDALSDRITIRGFGSAMLAAIIIGLVSTLSHVFLGA